MTGIIFIKRQQLSPLIFKEIFRKTRIVVVNLQYMV